MAKRIFHHLFSWRTLKHWFINYWPLFLLLGIITALSFLNYQPNTSLTGWDNLHSEFNFSLNLKNTLFSVWQEKGTGFLAGMSPAADLPRILFLGTLRSLGVVGSDIRYLWTFATLALGPVAVYFLLHHIFLKPKFDPETKKIASFLGALFYLLNLATLQYFFIPFEAFSAFFAFFPLIILATTLYFEKASPKHYLLLLLTLLISSPAFFVQTTFVVLSLCLLPILLRHFRREKKKVLIFLLTLLATQGYWLLPQIFFVATRAGQVGQSHANLLSSPETLHRNLQFANLKDLAFLKGFWFNILDPSSEGKFDYLFLVWRNHLANPTIAIIGYLSFALVLTGIVYSLKKKIPYTKSFLGIFVICCFFLLGGVQIIGSNVPLLGELFRSSFTKFSIPLAFTYAIFFSVGCIFLLDLFSFLHSRLTHVLTLFTVSLALVIFMTPAFTGNLISPQMRVKIPPEYFGLFEFFKNEDPATRIANFPQYTFWGWNYYSWGYRGSGFLWYGIRQPILDRGFDVWEKSSEKYYEEMSTALYSENQREFENLIDKYAINWLLIDNNIIAPSTGTDLGLTKLQKLIDNSDKFTLVFATGESASGGKNILVYRTNIDKQVKNFLSINNYSESPSQYPRRGGTPLSGVGEVLHPFASLPLRPTPLALDSSGSIVITAPSSSPPYGGGDREGVLTVPNYFLTEKIVPVSISYKKTIDGLTLKFEPILPKLKVDDKQIDLTAPPSYLDFPLTTSQSGYILAINDQYFELRLPEELPFQSTYYPVATTYLSTIDHLRASLYANSPFYTLDLTPAFAAATPSQCFTSKPNRKIEKIVSRDTVSLFGTDVVGCLSTSIPQPNDLNLLILLNLTYNSPTNTPANASISTLGLSSLNSPQPLIAKKGSTSVRFYAKPILQPLQANLILEANETRSTQEIDYQDVSVSYLPLLAESNIFLTGNPIQKIPIINEQPKMGNDKWATVYVSVFLPIIDSSLTVSSNPTHNLLSPEPINCDNFNRDKFDKQMTAEGTLYTATNANSCDSVNLRHLPHNTNYAILIDQQTLVGLPTTVCLENYSTKRCDVFERLINGKQLIIQPINNPNESSGYTLHLFNQSFGSRPTRNLIRSITVSPYPLNFLKNITMSTSTPDIINHNSEFIIQSSSHPAEFLYTANLNTSSDGGAPTGDDSSEVVLNLYQTKSPYWKALEVSESDSKLPLWHLIAKLPFLYFSNQKNELRAMSNEQWSNSWALPPGSHHLVIFYLPQYLEFLGFALLPLPIFGSLIYLFFHK